MNRRQLLAGAGAALSLSSLAGCVSRTEAPSSPVSPLGLAPIRAVPDRITRITVCTRPFRPLGPRIEAEKFDTKTVIHNYGHGGSGWSLSWGSGNVAVKKALETGEKDIAVIGCGALGLTAAIVAQKAGLNVTIYAKDLPPNVRSSLASGVWTPSSRICYEENATPALKAQWQQMCRDSHAQYQNLLGLPGDPIEWIDTYRIADRPRNAPRTEPPADPRPQFAELESELVPELHATSKEYAPGTHPFGQRWAYRNSWLMFNITAYSYFLISQFREAGGKIEIREFHSPQDVLALRQKTILNCTGYGAKALFGDQSIVPVRGQLARLPTQPDVRYSLFYNGVSFVPRRDGQVFQVTGPNDYYGFGDDTTVPDRTEAEKAVTTIASLFA
jgi:glycine/D-amino acid oxidase-like deaminating enzyme